MSALVSQLRTEQTASRRGSRRPVDTAALKDAFEARLVSLLPGEDRAPRRLHAAMRHAALAPGKRMRPLLTLLAARQAGGRERDALDAACAIELVHAASLVLDDLPCMDDAQTRRGQPTTHRAFGEDLAVLAAVGLLNQAYAVIAGCRALDVGTRMALTHLLAATVGPQGLLGGQEFDLRDRLAARDPATIHLFDHAKTGVLIEAALEAGALAAGADGATRGALRLFGRHLGAAFQTMDDMVDAMCTEDEARKDVGKDAGRVTLVTLMGVDGARASVLTHLEKGCAALAEARCGPDPLAGFARACLAPVDRMGDGT